MSWWVNNCQAIALSYWSGFPQSWCTAEAPAANQQGSIQETSANNNESFQALHARSLCAGAADPDGRINFHSDLASHAASCPSPGEVKAALRPAAPGHKGWAGRSSWHRGKLNLTCSEGCRGNVLQPCLLPPSTTATSSHTAKSQGLQFLYFQKLWRNSSSEYHPVPLLLHFPHSLPLVSHFRARLLNSAACFFFFTFLFRYQLKGFLPF